MTMLKTLVAFLVLALAFTTINGKELLRIIIHDNLTI